MEFILWSEIPPIFERITITFGRLIGPFYPQTRINGLIDLFPPIRTYRISLYRVLFERGKHFSFPNPETLRDRKSNLIKFNQFSAMFTLIRRIFLIPTWNSSIFFPKKHGVTRGSSLARNVITMARNVETVKTRWRNACLEIQTVP